MKSTTIKGRSYESYLVDGSGKSYILDSKATIFAGGLISEEDGFLFGYGIVENAIGDEVIHGNSYRVDGRIVGLTGAIATFGADTTITLGKTAQVGTSLGALGSGGIGPLFGTVFAYGEGSRINVARGAEVMGGIGITAAGSHSRVNSSGDVTGAYIGMAAGSITGSSGIEDIKLVNNGSIEAVVGMYAIGVDGAVLENGKNGDILAFSGGLGVMSEAGMHATINNFGSIRVTISYDGPEDSGDILGFSVAVMGGAGDETLKNTGTIIGGVSLGAGDDVINTVGGKIIGEIAGGEGDDMLVTDNASYALVELADEGTDTVQASVTYALTDNVENLTLIGKKAIAATGNELGNVIIGNSADNRLTGLGGIDTFAFATKGGKDTITDFTVGDDVIDVSGWTGMTDIDAIFAHGTDKGDDYVITLNNKDVLILKGVHEADLDVTGADFIFA